MRKFRVYRSGFNTANNPSAGARPENYIRHVATVESEDEDGAIKAALAQGITVYNNQSIWAALETECLEQEAKIAKEHEGQVLVKYWRGTTARECWCASGEDLGECLGEHSNSFPPLIYDAIGEETDYEGACQILGYDPDAEWEDEQEDVANLKCQK